MLPRYKISVIFLLGVLMALIAESFLFNTPDKHELISIFPLKNYDQTISHWIKPSDRDYDQALLTPQQQKNRANELYEKYFGERSPWSTPYINLIANHEDNIQKEELGKVNAFNNALENTKSVEYGSNFRPHTSAWINEIKNTMNLEQFAKIQYRPDHRAITIDSMQGRVLPTNDVSFNNHKIAGQGYPFDNLQAAMVWAGTPIYVLGETKDHSWSLVLTPNFIAWIKTNGIAKADEKFIEIWKKMANKHLAAITQTKIAINDAEAKSFRFNAYIGMMFPATLTDSGYHIAIPVADANQHAVMHFANLTSQQAAFVPLLATPHHFSHLIKQLIGRPYGWGGMYKNNDCSAELKSLFIPFGILLPAHSSNQINPEDFNVNQVDLSSWSMDKRLSYLSQYGHKFMTIVYVGGHVVLYLGTYNNPMNPKQKVILTYQDMWGLSPKNADDNYRSVVGKSVLFPLLKIYPENPGLNSQANKPHFQLGYLDSSQTKISKPLKINLKSQWSP